MIRFASVLVVAALSSVACLASAQDFTTQDPRYTTTPPQYTTTPAQYTTTPSQYTTTPPEYLPQADTVTLPGGITPTIPPNLPGSLNTGTNTGQRSGTNLGSITVPQTLQSQQLEDIVVGEVPEVIPSLELETPIASEPRVEWFARFVLRLDETETQQMVGDYFALLAQLGLSPDELSESTRVKIVLYLTLGRLLGLSGIASVTGVTG